MLVQVTTRHIQRGEPGHIAHCAVALALWEMGYSEVFVGNRIYLTKGDQRLRYRTPKIVQEWIDQFDHERAVQPFAFILDRPLRDRRRR